MIGLSRLISTAGQNWCWQSTPRKGEGIWDMTKGLNGQAKIKEPKHKEISWKESDEVQAGGTDGGVGKDEGEGL